MLRVCDVTYRYPRTALRQEALAELHLTLPAGRRVAMLGANGSGKSTLLLHLNGTLRPSQGHVECHGQIMGYSRKDLQQWRRRVSLVFQEPDHQIFAGTVAQDISFGPMNLGLSVEAVRDKVQRALHDLALEPLAHLPPHMLSHGQRKRVALAGALAMEPQALLMDEPTAGLDPRSTLQFLEALDRHAHSGMLQVISTHDLDLALEWAQEVVILHEGRLLASGEPITLLQDEALLKKAHLRLPYALRSNRAYK